MVMMLLMLIILYQIAKSNIICKTKMNYGLIQSWEQQQMDICLYFHILYFSLS